MVDIEVVVCNVSITVLYKRSDGFAVDRLGVNPQTIPLLWHPILKTLLHLFHNLVHMGSGPGWPSFIPIHIKRFGSDNGIINIFCKF
mgnify:CR=1 FL=1|jgi:hypothetical protein